MDVSPRGAGRALGKTRPMPEDEAGLYFARCLLARARAPTLAKTERTKLRLLAAAASLLDRIAFQELRATDVSKAAGVAHGTFYTYFDNKTEMAKELLTRFLEFIEQAMLEVVHTEEAFSTIYASTLRFVRFYRKNVGLMRCMRKLVDESHDFAKVERKADAGWFGRVAHNISKRLGRRSPDQDVLFLSYALGSMVDDFLYIRFLSPDPDVARLARSDEEIAEKLAIIWYRALFLRAPDAKLLQHGKSLARLLPRE